MSKEELGELCRLLKLLLKDKAFKQNNDVQRHAKALLRQLLDTLFLG
jgi:hypothetical protein